MTNVIGSDNAAGDKVKPIYGELRGLYHALIPTMSSTDETIGESYNSTVDELIKTTGQGYYSKFKVKIYADQFGNPFTDIDKLRAQLTSLLSRLHQEYFSGELSPFTTNTNTSKHQQQSVQNFYISGGVVHTGNGDIVQKVTVKDIIIQLSDEIEKIPEGHEKASALQVLKNITTNEAFANVLGASLGAFLSAILSPHNI